MPVLGDDNETTEIPSLATCEERKSLGVYFCPEGGSKKQMNTIKEKVDKWVNKMKNGYLPTYLAWMAYCHKLWPSARFGLGTTPNEVEAMESMLDKEDYESLNGFRVASTLKKGWRKLHIAFGGLGMVSLKTEQLIERILLLLQHYHTGSIIRKR